MAQLNDLLVKGNTQLINPLSVSSGGTGLSNITTNAILVGNGTGALTIKSAVDASNMFLNALTTGTSNPQAEDWIISQYAGGGTTTTTFHRRPWKTHIASIHNRFYATCTTDAATAAKVASTGLGAGFTFLLNKGALVAVKFTNAITVASATLNIDSTGAKAIYYRGAALAANKVVAGATILFVYNGTQYEIVSDLDTDTNTHNSSKNIIATTAAGTTSTGTTATTNTTTFFNHLENTTKTSSHQIKGLVNVNVTATDSLINISDLHYGTSDTAAGTQAKAVTCAGWKLETGAKITVKFMVTNTHATPQLNVNSTGAKAIKYRGANLPSAGVLTANRVYTFVYDGTNYELVGDLDTDTNTQTITSVTGTSPISVNPTTGAVKVSHVDSGVTAQEYAGTSNSGNVAYGATITIPKFTVNATGHVTAAGTTTFKLPASTVGNTMVPVYISSGTPTACNISLPAWGTCATAGGTAAKVVTSSNFKLGAGSLIVVSFSAINTATSPTLNVNSTGAKAIWYLGAAITSTDISLLRGRCLFVYDGTQYHLIRPEMHYVNYNRITPYTTDFGYAYTSGALDAITIPKVGSAVSNKSFNLKAADITIEYSTDGGTTWTDYGATNEEKRNLFTETRATNFYLGKATAKANNNVNNQLRVTITPTDRYYQSNAVYVWFSTQGNTCNMSMYVAQNQSLDTLSTIFENKAISGWSGNNIIYYAAQAIKKSTASGDTTKIGKIVFLFKMTDINAKYASAIVMDIRMFGDAVWTSPNKMVSTNHLYSWDTDLNATFQAKVFGSNIKDNGILVGIAGATADIGANNKPVYISYNSGSPKPVASTYTIGKSVPDDAEFTDTTYTLVSGASGSTTNTAATNGNVCLNLVENESVKNIHNIVGSNITITSDANGKITFTGKAGTVTSVATGVGLTGGSITSSGTIKAKLKSETAATVDSTAFGSTANRFYAVGVDKSGYLAVNVPWTDTTYTIPNNYSTIKVGTTTIGPSTTTDTLNIVQGSNVTLTAATDSITIAATDAKVAITNKEADTDSTWYPTFHTSATSTGTGIYTNNGFVFRALNGTTSTDGYAFLRLGNTTKTGVAGNKYGKIVMYSNNGGYHNIVPVIPGTTGSVTHTLTDTSGWLVGAATAGVGGANNPVYINSSGIATATNITSSNLIWYGTCSTAGSTRDKVINCPGYILEEGNIIIIKFDNSNSKASPRMNVNSTGLKDIYYNGAVLPTSNYINDYDLSIYRYNGTNYEYIGSNKKLYMELDPYNSAAAAGTVTAYPLFTTGSSEDQFYMTRFSTGALGLTYRYGNAAISDDPDTTDDETLAEYTGYARIRLGNNLVGTAGSAVDGNLKAVIRLYNNAGKYIDFTPSEVAGNRSISMPIWTTNGYLAGINTTNGNIGNSTTKYVYFEGGLAKEGTISYPVTSVTGTSPITVSPTTGAVVVSHANSGATAGTYGSVSTDYIAANVGDTFNIPRITVNATGHITTATTGTIFNKGYVYPVIGTQTAATNAWTGNINIPHTHIYDGLTIAYYLPWAGTSTAATLTLTYSDGETLGPVNVYWTGTSQATTHYGAGSTIMLTYWSAGSISVSGTATTNARWLRADYNTDAYTIREYNYHHSNYSAETTRDIIFREDAAAITANSYSNKYAATDAGSFQYTWTYPAANTEGISRLTLGNSVKKATAGNQSGQIRLYNAAGNMKTIYADTEDSDGAVELPYFGTVYGRLVGTNKDNVTATGSAYVPVYVDSDGIATTTDISMPKYATCPTAAGTAAKVATTDPAGEFMLAKGALVAVKFTNAITVASATLNVNDTGAKSIYYRGAALAANKTVAGATILFMYNGTQFEVIGDLDTDTNSDTKVSITNTNPTSAKTYYPTWHTATSGTGVTLNANDGLYYRTLQGTTSANGYSIIGLGNTTATGTAGNKYGILRLFAKTGGYYTDLVSSDVAAARTITIPKFTTNGYLAGINTTNGNVGNSTTKYVYFEGGLAKEGTLPTDVKNLRIYQMTDTTMDAKPIIFRYTNNYTSGSTSYEDYGAEDTNGLRYQFYSGTTSMEGMSRLVLGNDIASGTAGNQSGSVLLYSSKGHALTISTPSTTTAAATLQLPNIGSNTSGTLTTLISTSSPNAHRPLGATTDGILSSITDNMLLYNSTLTKGTAPSADTNSEIKFTDKNGSILVNLRNKVSTAKVNSLGLDVYSYAASGSTVKTVWINVTDAGSFTMQVPGNLVTGNPAVGTQATRNIYAGTSALTAGSSTLNSGVIYLQYEV